VSGSTGNVILDVGPVRAQPAGVGLYVALLARELMRDPSISLGLIGVRPEARALGELSAATPQRPFSTPSYHSWMQLKAEADAHALGARLIHFTNAAAPLSGRIPYVLTVHDLSLARMPMTHPVARWGIIPVNLVAVARARTVIVPSHWTASELERIGVDGRRIVVIAHAPALGAAEAHSSILARLRLQPGRYILYFGTLEPRKNIYRLVAAFERINVERPWLRLVLAGAPGWRFSGIQKRIAASPARERIILPGYVDDADLAALIADSGAVAYVSLYEGFGMPVLDAMALGAAVVTSRTTAMPEAAGGAALLVDPRDEGDIARGLATALERRAELIGPGQARAGMRTWAEVAAEHARVYRHALKVTDPA
jgi:glycosyltransferase involved in cell wall biosynthesis